MYTPFLRPKSGEMTAIENLSDDIRSKMVPVFLLDEEPHRVEYDGPHFIFSQASQDVQGAGRLLQPIGAAGAEYVYASLAEDGDLDPATVSSTVKHLFIDVGDVSSIQPVALRYLESALVSIVNSIANGTTVSLGGVSVPVSMGEVPRGLSRQDRVEWILYKKVRSQVDRPLFFADYGVRHPDSATDFQPYMIPGTKIKYTADDMTIIVKGGSSRHGAGFDQFHDLAEVIVALPEYRGAAFSWGDHRISEVARRATGPGNMTNWVAIETNHHITEVVNQLASLGVV